MPWLRQASAAPTPASTINNRKRIMGHAKCLFGGDRWRFVEHAGGALNVQRFCANRHGSNRAVLLYREDAGSPLGLAAQYLS